ncbi:MAG: HAMP domain-containing histidine kinase [Actinobacteria bacterium]|nr:HAMP domain-containing histidine kinase [Actinomycetota bacterium]
MSEKISKARAPVLPAEIGASHDRGSSGARMNKTDLGQMATLIRQKHHELLAYWRAEVRLLPIAEHLDAPTLNDHIPDLLDELACELEAACDETLIEAHLKENPVIHGLDRLRIGFDVEEVVTEYNVLRDAIQTLAERHGISLQGWAARIVNRVLDRAIGLAVKTYATQKALEVQQRREEHLSFVVHDLKSPLAAMSMAASVLERKLPDGVKDEEAVMVLNSIHRNAKRLNALIVKVLHEEANLDTITSLQLQRREVDLWPLVEALVEDLQPLTQDSGTRIANTIPKDLVVFADAHLLSQAFQNLLSNAIAYTPNGMITIGATTQSTDDIVECWVIDDGAGIPEDRIDKVFERLETDPDKEGGTGLGLAIVKEVVEAHGGQVTVESKLKEGTTFRFTLPGNLP